MSRTNWKVELFKSAIKTEILIIRINKFVRGLVKPNCCIKTYNVQIVPASTTYSLRGEPRCTLRTAGLKHGLCKFKQSVLSVQQKPPAHAFRCRYRKRQSMAAAKKDGRNQTTRMEVYWNDLHRNETSMLLCLPGYALKTIYERTYTEPDTSQMQTQISPQANWKSRLQQGNPP